MIINCVIAFGLPVVVMLLRKWASFSSARVETDALFVDIIVQPRRFDIFEEIGCQPVTFNTVAAYLLYFIWPILIGLCSFVYSGKYYSILLFIIFF